MCKKHARLVTKQVLLFIVGETLEFCTFITLLEIMNKLEIFLVSSEYPNVLVPISILWQNNNYDSLAAKLAGREC